MGEFDRQRRIRQLEQQIKALGASFDVDDDFDDETTELFLESVLMYERSPMTTLRAKLAETGYQPPLADAESATRDLWMLLRQLAFISVFVENTNHLGDLELYEWLLDQLDAPTRFPQQTGLNMYLDVSGKRQPSNTYDRDRFLPTYGGEAAYTS
jgi:hypothetical protein